MKHCKCKVSTSLIHLLLFFLLILSVVPFYLVRINGTHNSFDIVTRLNFLPGNALKDNYQTMKNHVNIWRGFLNSLWITIPYTILAGYFGAFTAYGFAKFNFRRKKILYIVLLYFMMLPSQVAIIGFYQLNMQLHMIDSYFPFILRGLCNSTTVFS